MPPRKRFRQKGFTSNPPPRSGPAVGGSFWIYGHHSVTTAIANPRRLVRRLLAVEAESQHLPGLAGRTVERADPAALASLLPQGAVHQGIAALVDPLPLVDLGELLEDLPARGAGPSSAAGPGDRPPECRGHPALGRGFGGLGRDPDGAPCGTRIGRPGQGGLRGAGRPASGQGGQSVAGHRGAEAGRDSGAWGWRPRAK